MFKKGYSLCNKSSLSPLFRSLVTNVNENSFTVSLYSDTKYNYAIGSATVYYSSNNSNLNFYDNYNFDPKPWGTRSYSAEIATRLTNNEGRYHGASSFHITY